MTHDPSADARRVEEARAVAAARPAWQRALWVLGGLSFVGVGAVGVVVPGLPTTPLLLLAAACFARSSPRLYAWLLRNETFGPLIEDYRAGRGVSARVKATAISMMAAFVTFALVVPLRGKTLASVTVFSAAVFGAAYILKLPTRPRDGAAGPDQQGPDQRGLDQRGLDPPGPDQSGSS